MHEQRFLLNECHVVLDTCMYSTSITYARGYVLHVAFNFLYSLYVICFACYKNAATFMGEHYLAGMLEELCHTLDLELENQSSFSLYSQELQRLQSLSNDRSHESGQLLQN